MKKIREIINNAGYGLPFLLAVVGGMMTMSYYPGGWSGDGDPLKVLTFSFTLYPALFSYFFAMIYLPVNQHSTIKKFALNVFRIFGVIFIIIISIVMGYFNYIAFSEI